MLSCAAIVVTEVSQIGETRRAAINLATGLGFGEVRCGQVALVVAEVANNLVKHARDGLVLLRPLEQGEAIGIEILALDKGPGMADIRRCQQDGFSTAASPGNGLGAIARLSTSMDIYSLPQVGTALVARLWLGKPPSPPAEIEMQFAAVSLPKKGETVCGDAWAVQKDGLRTLLLIADGLGHGPLAGEAAAVAVRVFRENASQEPVDILQRIHLALRSTRGAAVGLACVDPAQKVIRYVGVGNIAATILANGASRSLVSHNGTVGHEVRKFQEFTYPFPTNASLVMHSDGLATRWALDDYPGLGVRDPALIAGVLYRDFQRERDDVTVLVTRQSGGSGS